MLRLTAIFIVVFLVLTPVVGSAGSDQDEQAEFSLHKVLAPLKQSFLGWLEGVSNTRTGRATPKVTLDVPPAIVKQPVQETALPAAPPQQPEPPQGLADDVPITAVAQVPEVAQTVTVAPKIVEKIVAQEPVGEINMMPPGNPKPAAPVVAVSTPTPAPAPAPAPVPVPVPVPVIKETTPAPVDGALMLGQSMVLGVPFDGNKTECISKQNDYVLFCAQSVRWPQSIEQFFDTDGKLYRGIRAAVRYDGNRRTHAHALFKTAGLNDVLAYLKTRFGPPLETLQRIATPFEARPRNNLTTIWRKSQIVNGKMVVVTLEVRAFDDVRGSFPDMQYGLVRLYHSESLPIFPRISVTEMMLLKYALN